MTLWVQGEFCADVRPWRDPLDVDLPRWVGDEAASSPSPGKTYDGDGQHAMTPVASVLPAAIFSNSGAPPDGTSDGTSVRAQVP